MSIPRSNVSLDNISRKANSPKEKNVFELISELPKMIWTSELFFKDNQTTIEYCEIILREANRVNKDAVDLLEFESEENIKNFIFQIEAIVVRGNPLFYNEHSPKNKIYIDEENEKLKVTLGISEIEPSYIYSVSMNAIYNIKALPLKIGYAHFLRIYQQMTANGIDSCFEEMYPDLKIELEQMEDYEGDEDHTDHYEYLKNIKECFENDKIYYKKVLKYWERYIKKSIKEFYDYEPKNDKEWDLKFHLEIAIKKIPPFFSNYGFSLEDDCAEFETMFNIFICDDANADRENDAINSYAQNGVSALQAMLDITNEKPDLATYQKSIDNWTTLENSLNKIINITSEKC